MKKAVTAPATIRRIQKSVEASRKASWRRPFCRRSVKTGTNAAERAAFANRLLTKFGTWLASANAEAGAPVPKKLAATISRTSPATREKPVKIEKIAVLRTSLSERLVPRARCERSLRGTDPLTCERSPGVPTGGSPVADKAAIVRRCAAPEGAAS